MQIRRFIKYRLGEGLEKRSTDFAAEVAQQTQAKAAAPAPKKEEPKKAEEPKKPAVQVHCNAVSTVLCWMYVHGCPRGKETAGQDICVGAPVCTDVGLAERMPSCRSQSSQ
jgi:hypothetical protein